MNYPATGKYIVRDSAIETYLWKHGSLYDNSVVWYRSIFNPEGREIDSQRLQRDFDTQEEAKTFGSVR